MTPSLIRQPPALSLVLRRARSLLEERAPLAGDLASLVEIDAVLTGTLLRVMRCPVYGAGKSRWAPAEALERIGRPVLLKMLDTLPTLQQSTSRDEVERACRHWGHGVAVAATARWLSNQGEYADPMEAYLAGLVVNIGHLLTGPTSPSSKVQEETEALLANWRASWRVTEVARHLLRPADGAAAPPQDPGTRRLLEVLQRSQALAASLGFGLDGRPAEPSEDEALNAVRDAVALEMEHAAALLGLPSGAADDFLRVLTNEELLLTDSAGGPRSEPAEAAVPDRTPINVAAVHQTVLAMRGMNRVGDILHAGLRSLHKGLDFDRVILLDTEPGQTTRLRGRLILDPTRIEVRRGPRSLVLPADANGAVQRALDTGMPGRGCDSEDDRWALERLGVDCFAVAPLRAGPANLGLVVADRFFVRKPITDTDVAMLGLLCASLGLVVENMALDTQAKKLRSLAVMDELTGINNRRNLLLNLQREIERARRYGKPLTVVMIDVDHFKRWNDMHGHQVGDMVLQRVAQLVSSVSREIDSYGRYGGEEFLVVLPETPLDQAVVYAERLRVAVEQQGVQLQQQFPGTSLTISIGVTNLAPTGDDLERTIQRADASLYASKKRGRNCVSVLAAGQKLPAPAASVVGVEDGAETI